MLDILNELRTALVEAGNDNVYFAFDTVPVSSKGSFITVIGAKSYEAMTPVYSQYTIFIPFRTELEVILSAPERCTMSQVYGYFEEKVLPAINGISGLSSSLSSLVIKHDTNMKRLVLTAGIKAGGVQRIERESL
ncbi:MAG: hypothetical protein K5979_02415 [Ruminococcus sp.]|nr:hypothetical protein [Ruminococcus sp.]